MVRRQFNETDLRELLERATDLRQDVELGRWLVSTSKDQQPREVVVEPQWDKRVLLAITAYKVEPL